MYKGTKGTKATGKEKPKKGTMAKSTTSECIAKGTKANVPVATAS